MLRRLRDLLFRRRQQAPAPRERDPQPVKRTPKWYDDDDDPPSAASIRDKKF
jgi:hypothetical protein